MWDIVLRVLLLFVCLNQLPSCLKFDNADFCFPIKFLSLRIVSNTFFKNQILKIEFLIFTRFILSAP